MRCRKRLLPVWIEGVILGIHSDADLCYSSLQICQELMWSQIAALYEASRESLCAISLILSYRLGNRPAFPAFPSRSERPEVSSRRYHRLKLSQRTLPALMIEPQESSKPLKANQVIHQGSQLPLSANPFC